MAKKRSKSGSEAVRPGHDAEQELDYWEEMAARRRSGQAARQVAQDRSRRELEKRVATDEAAQLAARGEDDKPIGNRRTKQITIDLTAWARHIEKMGRAWKVHPGVDVVRARPIPDQGQGIEAGLRIFELACGGYKVREIARELRAARDALGHYDPTEGGSDVESFYGVWVVFKQLARFYDGGWNPPLPPRSERRPPSTKSTDRFPSLGSNQCESPDPPASRGQLPRPAAAAAVGQVLLKDGEDDSGMPIADSNIFVRAGKYWEVTFEGEKAVMKDMTGMGYLALLIENRGTAVNVRDLESPGRLAASYGGDEVLDADALADYRARLRELSADLEEAQAREDDGRTEVIDNEISTITRLLSSGTALGGRARRQGDEVEPIRSRVRAAIKRALSEIEHCHASLYEHLSAFIESPTGKSPVYRPPEGTSWFVVRHVGGAC